MPDQRLVYYIRNNMQLGYPEESIRHVLISAGYNVRDIDDAIYAVKYPAAAQPAIPAPPPPKKKKKQPWLWLAIGGTVAAIVIIAILLTSVDREGAALLSSDNMKIPSYTLTCNAENSMLELYVRNTGPADIPNLQLYVDAVFQVDQNIASLGKGTMGIFSYMDVNCADWTKPRNIKIVSDTGEIAGSIAFECTTGTC